MKLEEARKLIDEIDTEILSLLNRRTAHAQRIGRMKKQAGLPIVDLQREETILRRIVRESTGDIDDQSLIWIYEQILAGSRRAQNAALGKIAGAGEIRK
jgi:chorismate mutase